MERYFEITEKTVSRVGVETIPADPVEEIKVIRWWMKEGDVIETGSLLVDVDFTKGLKTIDPLREDIGWRIKKILMPGGTSVENFDIRKEPFRLAILERDGLAFTEIRATPTAERVAKTAGISLDEVQRSLGLKSGTRITRRDVERIRTSVQILPSMRGSEKGILISAAVRKEAKERGIDVTSVTPTGEGGIITARDVEQAAQRAIQKPSTLEVPPAIAPLQDDLSPESSPNIYTLSRYQMVTAGAMTKSLEIPHAGPGIDIDPVPLMKFLKKHREEFSKLHGGLKLRIDHFFAHACALLLADEAFQMLNTRWREKDGRLSVKHYEHVNLGIAVSVPPTPEEYASSLMVPNIRQAETLRFSEMAVEAERIIRDARKREPGLNLLNTTFIVDNTGAPVTWRDKTFPGDEFPEPRIAPQTCAILAFGAARKSKNGKRMKMRVVLRFDHRVVSGKEPIAFIRTLQYMVEHPQNLLLF